MTIQRTIIVLLLTISTFIPAQAQLKFSSDKWNFGTIAESGGPVSHTFTAVNQSTKPVVIIEVVASCGCTRPEFTRQPILPGEEFAVKVTYDPMNRPGSFSKALGVFSSERIKLATLTIEGSVTPRTKSDDELYPFDAGSGLRLSETLCAFAYIPQQKLVQSAIGFKNTSPKPIHLELVPDDPSGLLQLLYSPTVGPSEEGSINIAYFIPDDKPRYGTLRDALRVRVNGRSNGTTIVVHGIGIDPPVSAAEKQKAAKSAISKSFIKFGEIKHSAPQQEQTFELRNEGSKDLIVRAVETGPQISTTLQPGQKIAPGGFLTVKVMLDPAKQEYGSMTDYLMIVTNDSNRPMWRLRVSAIIVD